MKLGEKNYTFLKRKYHLDDNLLPGDLFSVSINELSKGSHLFINVVCDYCGKELKVPYKRYNLSTKIVNKYACSNKECSNKKIKDVCIVKYGVENPFQSDFFKNKAKETLNKKYGVDHPMFIQETKDKIKKTCIERYGVDSYAKTNECINKIKKTCIEKYGVDHHSKTLQGQEKRKITRISKGLQVPDNLVSEYRKYRLSVNRITNRLKIEIISRWDGFDHYDGEYIKDYFNLPTNNRRHPNLDHKISVIYGFYNKINPQEIGCIDNICITKSWINGFKGGMCELEFIQIFKK